ncbi:hypothetical protein D3C81_2339990 [compost metagenome]
MAQGQLGLAHAGAQHIEEQREALFIVRVALGHLAQHLGGEGLGRQLGQLL